MALSPAEIHRTLRVSETLNKQGNSTQSFILAWTAWEAYNFRFILNAIQMQGITQEQARSILHKLHSYQVKNMNRIRDRLLLDRPQEREETRAIWHQLESDRTNRTFRERRHGLVHGHKSADPRILRRGADLIRDALQPNELLEDLRVRIKFGDAAASVELAGPVLVANRRHTGSRRGTGNVSGVLEWLS